MFIMVYEVKQSGSELLSTKTLYVLRQKHRLKKATPFTKKPNMSYLCINKAYCKAIRDHITDADDHLLFTPAPFACFYSI